MDKVKKLIEELNLKFPRPGLRLEVSEPFDTTKPWNYSTWPNNGFPGVYLFADDNDKVVYIGKASKNISVRLGEYWRKGPSGETESCSWKSEDVRFVYTIGLPVDRFFEASSIEEYLISKVNPERNTNGKYSVT